MVRGEDREFGVAAQADRTSRHGSTAGCGEDNGRDLDGSCGRCPVWRFDHTAWHYFGTIPSAAVLVALPYLIAVAPLFCMREVYRRLGMAAVATKDKGRSRTELCESSSGAGAGAPSTAI